MAALTNAVQPAIPSWSDAVVVQGKVATPRWTGPVSVDHSGGPQTRAPGSVEGPVDNTIGLFELMPTFPDIPGSLGDTAADMYGHAAPMADFDSNAGEPFAPSGPVADTHGHDTGGTTHKSFVLEPDSPGWYRRTGVGQTYNSQSYTYDPQGFKVYAPNDRFNRNEYQGQNVDGYDPYTVPYSERPVYLNVAHETVARGNGGTPYEPSGQLSPVGPQFWTDSSNIYESPPDPSANAAASQEQSIAPSVGLWG